MIFVAYTADLKLNQYTLIQQLVGFIIPSYLNKVNSSTMKHKEDPKIHRAPLVSNLHFMMEMHGYY